MERGEQWRMLLDKLGCIHGDGISSPEGKRVHFYFGALDVSPRVDRPLKFNDRWVEAHDIHFTGDTTYILWEDLTSVSVR